MHSGCHLFGPSSSNVLRKKVSVMRVNVGHKIWEEDIGCHLDVTEVMADS